MPASPTLLLVEDDPTMQMFLKRLLAADYAVTTVSTGREALDAWAESAPQVLVLDVGLPDMSGHDVLETLGKTNDLADTAVLVLTGDERSTASVRSLELGADDHLEKPFNPDELRLRLKRLVNAHKSGTP